MRFLLVNPYYPISETPSPPLGLTFLAAALERAGVEVKILDFVVFPYGRARLARELADFDPQMMGVTSVTMSYDHAARIVRDAKQINPGIVTVMGGPHVTFRAEKTLEELPEADIIVRGEGEKALVDLARRAQKDRDWEKVQGLVFRRGGDLVDTGVRPPIASLDSLPTPARHLIPLGRYRALGMPVSMTTSRGCPFHCIFCVGRKMVGAKVRYRSPEKVVDELAYLATLNFHQINIADDLFTANPGHCMAVCDEILRRGLKVGWTSFARVDTVRLEVLKKMKAAGCHTVSFGVESANARILKTIKKGITTDQVITAVKMCGEAGIVPHASFILGLPGETPETIQETAAFGLRLKELGVSYGFHLLAPFPGTEVRERAAEYGIRILTDDWSQYHANRAIVETEAVDRETLDRFVGRWEEDFNLYLGDIKRRMASNEATREETATLENLERAVFLYDLMMSRTLEEKGSWNGGPDGRQEHQALETLLDRIGDFGKLGRRKAQRILQDAEARGDLRCVRQGGRTSWEWVNRL